MTDIVFVGTDGQAVTTSLAIAEGTGVQHKNILERIRKNNIDFNDFGRVTFETQTFETAGGIQNREVAILNEQHATLLLTYMRNNEIVKKFKKHLVKSFFEIRNVLRSQPPATTNMSKLDILKLAIESEEKRIELERQNKGLQDQINEDAPLVALAQRVSDYGDAVKLDIAAKAVDVPPMKYRQSVKDMGWLRADGHPMQFAIDRGYMKVKIFPVHHKHGAVTDSYTPLITGKGQVKVAQHYKYSFSAQSDLFARTVN